MGCMSFLFALNRGQEQGWRSPAIVACFIATAIFLMAFLFWEKRARRPLLDMSLFRSKAFTYGNLASGLTVAFLGGSNFLMPFYLEYVKGMGSEHTGLVILSYSAVYMAVSFAAGRAADKINPRTLCIFGMSLGSVTACG